MHAGKSVFILCGKHYILAITRHFITLRRGKNHSHKLRWSSFLMFKLTKLTNLHFGAETDLFNLQCTLITDIFPPHFLIHLRSVCSYKQAK